LIASGNRCGHNPARPVLQLVRPTSERMHPLISEAMLSIEKLFYNQREFPELGGRRSERREAVVRVGKALIYRMDLETMRVGELRSDGYVAGIPVRQLAAWTGLSQWRVERAISDLKRAHYGTAKQPRELVTDAGGEPLRDDKGKKRYRGLAAIRTVSRRLFARLHLRVALLVAQRSKARRREREAAAAAAASPAPELRVPLPRPKTLDDNRHPGEAAMVAQIWQQHREWSADQVRAEARRRLTGPPE
jgi:hypothetical protein